MTSINGVGVSPGRVIGPVLQMPPAVSEPPANERIPPGATAAAESQRVRAAAADVQADLQALAEAASGDVAEVLQATALMATDPALIKSADDLLGAGRSAERAVWEAAESLAGQLEALGGYMAERAADVLDIRARIVARLRGVAVPGIPDSTEPFILAAEDLAPADTAGLDRTMVLALVTSGGGPQSHTAILARALGLPAVVAAAGVTTIPDGVNVYVDGAAGRIVVEPGNAEREAAAEYASRAALPQFSGQGTTADGHPVPLLANVGAGPDAVAAAAAGAQGVGLLRTEFCFLDRDAEPAVGEQVEAYRAVFDAFGGKKVVVRTLDGGADKPLPFLTDSAEPNPALGVRGYRTDPVSPGVLDRQLQAIAAAAEGSAAEVWVMAPMVSTVVEARDFVGRCSAAGLRTAGVMVEVPSAALTAGPILRYAAFASIGTNDLTQYAMAADRQLGALAELNDPWQPAVLQLVRATVTGAAEAAGVAGAPKPVGVCGEAAADPALAVVLVGLGVETLSMSARSISAVAAVLESVTLAQAQELATVAVAAESATQARASVRAQLPILETLGL
jgi:phosphotransferase system enzyme I (PtsI)